MLSDPPERVHVSGGHWPCGCIVRRMTASRVAGLVGLTLLLVGGRPFGPALAQQPAGGRTTEQDLGSDERARAAFRIAEAEYAAGRFREAAADFEEAYRMSNRPALLFNVYVAWRDANELESAASALQRYLELEENVQDRITLEARLRSMRDAITRTRPLPPAVPQPAQQPAAAVAPAATPASDSGQTVAAREREVTAGAREASDQQEPSVEPQPAPRPHARSGRSVVPLIVSGLGGALVVGSVVTGVLAMGKVSDIEANCPGDACVDGYDLEGARKTARTLVTVTDALWIGGAVVAGAGLVWFFLQGGGQEEREAPVASASCGPDGCSAGLRVTF